VVAESECAATWPANGNSGCTRGERDIRNSTHASAIAGNAALKRDRTGAGTGERERRVAATRTIDEQVVQLEIARTAVSRGHSNAARIRLANREICIGPAVSF